MTDGTLVSRFLFRYNQEKLGQALHWGTFPICDILAELVRRQHLTTGLAGRIDVVGNSPIKLIGSKGLSRS